MSFLSYKLDPSLTVANVCAALEDIVRLDDLCYILNVPKSKKDEIQAAHAGSSLQPRKKAIVEDYLNKHPAPSWNLMAEYLYRYPTHHGTLQNVMSKYIKGKSLGTLTHCASIVP